MKIPVFQFKHSLTPEMAQKIGKQIETAIKGGKAGKVIVLDNSCVLRHINISDAKATS